MVPQIVIVHIVFKNVQFELNIKEDTRILFYKWISSMHILNANIGLFSECCVENYDAQTQQWRHWTLVIPNNQLIAVFFFRMFEKILQKKMSPTM